MSATGKSDHELIAEVDAGDLARARDIVARSIRNCSDEWIAPWLIADALAMELVSYAGQHTSSGAVAGYLRELAASLDADDGKKQMH